VLATLLVRISRVVEPTAGFAMTALTWREYALTQPGVILHYLRLALWPSPLVLDYWWPVARTFHEIVPPLLLVVGLIVFTVWAWRRHPAASFVGLWGWLTLAPSSSVLPIADLAAEHRMYLPLVSIVVLTVFGVWHLIRRLPLAGPWRAGVAGALAAAVVAAGAIGTSRRNAQYRSDVSIWRVTVAQRPNNPRAHNGLATALARERRFEDAAVEYAHALRLKPDYAQAHNDAGTSLMTQGKLPEAIVHLSEAVRLSPTYAQALSNLGVALSKQGRHHEANAYLRQALRLDPRNADVHYNVGNALAKQGAFDAAASAYAHALRLKPELAEAHNNWGNVLAIQGHVGEALTHYAAALRIQPHHDGARHNLETLSNAADHAAER
jgi:Flp pilus assembly protein TadD